MLLKVRQHDVARVSLEQLEGLRQLMDYIELKIESAGKDPTTFERIAVLHHHLLPVSTSEEFKSFESLTDLGLFRHFLRENGFSVLLHGHKHTGYIYRDHIYDLTDPLAGAPHCVLIISGATIGGSSYQPDEICRLLDINAQEYASTISVTALAGVPTGGSLKLSPKNTRRFLLRNCSEEHIPSTGEPEIITGNTLSETYAQMMSLLEDQEPNVRLYNIICQVKDPATAKQLPGGYPDIRNSERPDLSKWLMETVEWWQKPESRLGEQYFTHGHRIRRYDGSMDQIDRVIEILGNKVTSSRAVVTLLDPSQDDIRETSIKFPAFCLVQFVIRNGPKGDEYLDCMGYFRKQELRYWWPVNMAELARLQEEVQRGLILKYGARGLKLGMVSTITAIGVVGTSIPRVLVPSIDRFYDEDPNTLWSLVYGLVWEHMPNRSAYLGRWIALLQDLMPPETPDQDGVPVAMDGIEFVIETLSRFTEYHQESRLQALLGVFTERLCCSKFG
jgi:thymidylate synthase